MTHGLSKLRPHHGPGSTRFDAWLDALEARHLANLTLSEAARALRALSSTYVERRTRLERVGAFDSAGKRAAYALYYSPVHFLTVCALCEQLGLAAHPVRHVLDLGCGAGASGAAWAVCQRAPAGVTGVDVHPWALTEAAFTYRHFDLRATVRRVPAGRVLLPRSADAVVAGWTINELDPASRVRVHDMLLAAAARGITVLVVEPIAARPTPWWRDWAATVTARGGRADEWRLAVDLPPLLRRLARAAGLQHDVITAKSLLLDSRRPLAR